MIVQIAPLVDDLLEIDLVLTPVVYVLSIQHVLCKRVKLYDRPSHCFCGARAGTTAR